MSKADELSLEIVLEPEQLAQWLDCAHRDGCLDTAVRRNWRAWTCQGCDAHQRAGQSAVDHIRSK